MKQTIKIISLTVLIALIMGPIPSVTAFESHTVDSKSNPSSTKVSVLNKVSISETLITVAEHEKDCSWFQGGLIIQGSVGTNQIAVNNCLSVNTEIEIRENLSWSNSDIKVAEYNSFFTGYKVAVQNNSSDTKFAAKFRLSSLQNSLEEFLPTHPENHTPLIVARANILHDSQRSINSWQLTAITTTDRNLILLC